MVSVSSKNCVIEAKDKLIAVVGLEDIVVVDTDDATLVCDKEHAGEIKKISLPFIL